MSRLNQAEYIAAYRPRSGTVTKAEWRAIAPFVRDVASRFEPMAPTTLRNYLNATTAHVGWAYTSGLPLDVEVIFTPTRIEQYIQTATAHLVPNSRGTRRASLFRVGRQVTRKVAWAPPVLEFPSRKLAAPYTADEIAVYFQMASQQGTESRRRIAAAQLCLGLGAGLRADEYLQVGQENLVLHDEVFMMDIPGRRARKVPIHSRYAHALLEIGAEHPDEPYIGRLTGSDPSDRLDGLLSKPQYPRVRRPTTNRLRTTWLLRMLRSRCSISEILYMSGLQSTSSLIDLAAYVEFRDVTDWFGEAATFHD